MDAIVADKLTRRFDGAAAVDGLSLSVGQGEVFGLVGPDGAGKTTTLRLLASILTPSGGAASVAGYDVVRQAESVKEHIGYMSQRFGLYADLTVSENLDFYADIYGVRGPERRRRMGELLDFSGLLPFRKRLAGDLSGGMKQKLGLACALIHTPRVLLLDEPTNGVDPVSRRDFWQILYGLLRQGVTILLSTAYLDEAERCSRVGLMHHGRLIATGTPQEVRGMMAEAIVEVRCQQPRRAMGLLRRRMPQSAVALFGDRLHVRARDADEAIAAVRDELAAGGISLQQASLVEPTLEDVFVSLVGAEDAHAG